MGRTVLALFVMLLVLFAGASAMTDGFTGWTSESLRRQRIAAHPVPVPIATLVDAQGQSFSLDTAIHRGGKVVLIDFIYTRCNTVCSALGGEFEQLQHDIVARGLRDKVSLLSISFDPAHDDPAALAAYAQRMHADPVIWRFATTHDAKQLPLLLQTFGIVVIPDGYGGWTHNAAIHIVGTDGKLSRILDVDEFRRALAIAAAGTGAGA
ncbi:MAG: SCO family protein [Burkholderiales bacterium]|nr:SCO family protein [Burkholderiales bacterium]